MTLSVILFCIEINIYAILSEVSFVITKAKVVLHELKPVFLAAEREVLDVDVDVDDDV